MNEERPLLETGGVHKPRSLVTSAMGACGGHSATPSGYLKPLTISSAGKVACGRPCVPLPLGIGGNVRPSHEVVA
jgi:hypothetical protein